jgi:hypothetical protein
MQPAAVKLTLWWSAARRATPARRAEAASACVPWLRPLEAAQTPCRRGSERVPPHMLVAGEERTRSLRSGKQSSAQLRAEAPVKFADHPPGLPSQHLPVHSSSNHQASGTVGRHTHRTLILQGPALPFATAAAPAPSSAAKASALPPPEAPLLLPPPPPPRRPWSQTAPESRAAAATSTYPPGASR